MWCQRKKEVFKISGFQIETWKNADKCIETIFIYRKLWWLWNDGPVILSIVQSINVGQCLFTLSKQVAIAANKSFTHTKKIATIGQIFIDSIAINIHYGSDRKMKKIFINQYKQSIELLPVELEPLANALLEICSEPCEPILPVPYQDVERN